MAGRIVQTGDAWIETVDAGVANLNAVSRIVQTGDAWIETQEFKHLFKILPVASSKPAMRGLKRTQNLLLAWSPGRIVQTGDAWIETRRP